MEYLKKTRWVVRINESKNERVLIEYIPTENKFIFSGQVKIGDYQVDFSKFEILIDSDILIGYNKDSEPIFKKQTVDDIEIDKHILFVYNDMLNKIENYNNFNILMKEYTNIKIDDENN
jgi:hypothetical protein